MIDSIYLGLVVQSIVSLTKLFAKVWLSHTVSKKSVMVIFFCCKNCRELFIGLNGSVVMYNTFENLTSC